MLEIHVEDKGEYILCRPVGELDAYTVGQFREALGDVSANPRLLIDLSEVPFMDSAGLGALIGGIRRAREAEGDVAVACSRPTLTLCGPPSRLLAASFRKRTSTSPTLEETNPKTMRRCPRGLAQRWPR